MDLQNRPFHLLHLFINEVDFGVSQLTGLEICAWVVAELVNLLAFLHLHHQSERSKTARMLSQGCSQQGVGQHFPSHTPRDGSLAPSGLALRCFSGEVQGPQAFLNAATS